MAAAGLKIQVREQIMTGLAMNPAVSWTELSKQVGCHRSTIQREVARNGGRAWYRASKADARARRLRKRSRACLFDTDRDLKDRVVEYLVKGYSPYAVARFVGISPETIYRAIYDHRLGLDPEQTLRTRRRKRRHRHLRQPTNDGNFLGQYTSISQRDPLVETRTTFGHWEGDLITGTANQSAIITLTERLSRYQVALDLVDGHSADNTISRLRQWLETKPVIYSLTWDQGGELTRWKQLLDHHQLPVFFCDPKSPWQRASNENANRQLRFWFPRRTNLRGYTQADMNHACHILNTTPRRIHQDQTAQQVYDHHARTHR